MPRRLPVFPLGTVLTPGGLLPLHVFEARYRALVADLAAVAEPEMGVVLIERGSEVGGGEVRAGFGTIARLVRVDPLEAGRFLVLAEGRTRFRVLRWLPDDPYPIAEAEEVDDPPWEPGWDEALHVAEQEVRRALALAAELGEASRLPPLPSDRVRASWLLCAAAPVGPFDRQQLLLEPDTGRRLARLAELAKDSASVLRFRLGGA